MTTRVLASRFLALVCAAFASNAVAIDPVFTYQGFLTDQGQPAAGPFDFQFTLLDASELPVTAPVTRDGVDVAGGVFTVQLDFPFPAFNGQARRLQIAVRRPGAVDYTTLTPSTLVTAAPYSLLSSFAEAADAASIADLAVDASALGGVPALDYVRQTDPRLTDSRVPLPGSPSYIQNQGAVPQAGDFRVSGTGAANILSASTQYNLGATRVLSFGNLSVYLGEGTAAATTSGNQNVFVGWQAGSSNTSGAFNSFVGLWAGRDNSTGIGNNFYGSETGRSNTTGCCNSFFGGSAGFSNQTGSFNTFVGERSAQTQIAGDYNATLGANINVSNALVNATALGARASVTQSNSLVLGAIAGVNGAPTDTRVGIGTTAPKAKLDVTGGDILAATPGAGVILKSPNGALCRKLSIDNAGAIVLAAVTCP